MTILSRTMGVVALASLFALAGRPASAQTTGTLTHDGKSVALKGSVAVLDPKGTAVRIYLLPFAPTAAETALLQKESTLFLMEKKSAWASLWLNWKFSPADVGKLEKASVSLRGTDVAGPNTQFSRMFMSGIKGTLTGELKAGSTLGLAWTGGDGSGRDAAAWEVKASTKVLPAVAQ
jgi:hypothetical protein